MSGFIIIPRPAEMTGITAGRTPAGRPRLGSTSGSTSDFTSGLTSGSTSAFRGGAKGARFGVNIEERGNTMVTELSSENVLSASSELKS